MADGRGDTRDALLWIDTVIERLAAAYAATRKH